jgi:hypothetical protein
LPSWKAWPTGGVCTIVYESLAGRRDPDHSIGRYHAPHCSVHFEMRSAVALSLVCVLAAGSQTPQQWGQRQRPGGCVPPENTPSDFAFYFTRAVYSDYSRWGRRSWSTDCPAADRHFVVGLRRLTDIDVFDQQHLVPLEDPGLRHFPLLYAVEVGRMALTDEEIKGLRSYLLAGGMLIVDDFWGSREWANFEREISGVLPEFPIVELPRDHAVLGTFYHIKEILQVPNVGNAVRGGPTWEQDGYVPHLRAIFDDRDRLLVLINWNTDLGDAWEWADDPYYPLTYSNYAYRLGVNMVLYGMTH